MKKWHEYCLKLKSGKYNAGDKRDAFSCFPLYSNGFEGICFLQSEEKNAHGHMLPHKIRREESFF